jgi:transposase InsO family protein
MSLGHLSRLCRGRWHAAGVARLDRPPEGGRSCWWIAESADPAFAAVKFPSDIPFDLRTLTESQRKSLLSRKRVLDNWQLARAGGVALGFAEKQVTSQFLSRLEAEEDRRISRSTLFRWLAEYRRGGLGSLRDRRGGAGGKDQDQGAGGSGNSSSSSSGNGEFLDAMKGYYLSPNRPSAKSCWMAACLKASEKGFAVLGYRAACLFLAGLPSAVKTRRRDGEDAFVERCEPSIQRDYTTLRSNEQWVGDHHRLDVIVEDNGKLVRPWLTAWMDMRSRTITGWCIYSHAPNQTTILSALRGGITQAGVPELLYIDNGKDFGSRALHGTTKKQRKNHRRGGAAIDEDHVRGVLGHLQCKARFCWAYHGQSKPIERFFGTLEDQFGRTWSTYRGNCPANRPEDSELKLARGEAPTLADFTAAFADWLGVYHAAAHEGDGMDGASPAQVFDRSFGDRAKCVVSSDLLDLLLMRQPKPVRVHKNGVTWQGMGYGQYTQLTIEHLRRWVYLRIDERDISSVQVWTEDDRFICIAPANQRVPANATEQEMRAAGSQKRGHRKRLREIYQRRTRLAEDIPDLMIRARAAANAAGAAKARGSQSVGMTAAGPPDLKMLRSPLLEQLPAVRRGAQFVAGKLAAGAENVDSRFLYQPTAVDGDMPEAEE